MISRIFYFAIFCSVITALPNCRSEEKKDNSIGSQIHPLAKRLMNAYPDYIVIGSETSIVWLDGTSMLIDDNLEKSSDQILNAPDIQDQFAFKYPLLTLNNQTLFLQF